MKTRLYLASRSPRRRALLAEAGFEHAVVETGVDDAELERERAGHGVPAHQWVAALAYLKARAGAEGVAGGAKGEGEWTVLGADTVCVKHGEMIGQAADADEARRILHALEDGGHEVLTGVALVSVGGGGSGEGGGAAAGGGRPVGRRHCVRRRVLFVDRASVRVGRLGRERIEAYVASGQWRGKAGAYNLRERLEDGWPIEYVGDPTTIMGLPMGVLRTRLARLMEDP